MRAICVDRDSGQCGRESDQKSLKRKEVTALPGRGWGRGALALREGRWNRGNGYRHIVRAIAFLVFAVSSDTIYETFALVDQHRETGERIVIGLPGLGQTGEQLSILGPSSDPCLQADETQLRVRLHHPYDVGIPRKKWLDPNDMLDRVGQIIHQPCRGR